MTPDELRRMDNDLCIIFEKGIKPVKANKFYYFKHNKIATALRKSEISHNNVESLDRGTWRKFNPYNPWTEDKSEKEAENLKVDSLDDLFEDELTKEQKVEPVKENVTANVAEPSTPVQSIDDMFDDLTIETNTEKPVVEKVTQKQEIEDTYDLQKELEAKFDELFGPLDD